MKLPKFLVIACFLTLVSLVYVHQQTEIFRLAYVGGKQNTLCQDLLDKNALLRYNIDTSASVVRLGSKISAEAGYEMPGSYELVRMSNPQDLMEAQRENMPKRQNMLARFFSVKRQAEAKTINP